MPAVAAITINDGATTPAAHTFSPSGSPDGSGAWPFRDNNAGGIPVGENLLTVASSLNGRRKVSVRFSLPQIADQEVNGVTSKVVTRVARASLVFDFAIDSTTQERKDAVAFVRNLLATSQTAMFEVLTEPRNFY